MHLYCLLYIDFVAIKHYHNSCPILPSLTYVSTLLITSRCNLLPFVEMSCDITKVFLSTVRALRASSSSSQESASRKSSLQASSPNDIFSTRAQSLRTELTAVKRHIANAGELSLALATDDAARQRMYHDLAQQIGDALEQCGELLKQLKRQAVTAKAGATEGAPSKSQLTSHRKSVCRSLEELLKSLRRTRDEQVRPCCINLHGIVRM